MWLEPDVLQHPWRCPLHGCAMPSRVPERLQPRVSHSCGAGGAHLALLMGPWTQVSRPFPNTLSHPASPACSRAGCVSVAAPQAVVRLVPPLCGTSCSRCPSASLPAATWYTSPRALPFATAPSSRCWIGSLAAPSSSAPSRAVASSPPCARCGTPAPTASRCRRWSRVGSGLPASSSFSSPSRLTPTDTAKGQEGTRGHISSCPSSPHQWGNVARGELSLHHSSPPWTPLSPPAAPACIAFTWGQSLTQQGPGHHKMSHQGITRCPASLSQSGFVATPQFAPATLEQTQLLMALAAISPRVRWGGGDEQGDSSQ